MNNVKVAAAFNEWMRRFIEEPDRFSREFQEVTQYLSEIDDDKEPTYGRECAAYLEKIMGELA